MELIRRIVIAGGDAVASSVAAAIATSLRGQPTQVIVVEPGPVPPGASSTLPLTSTFHHHLGLGPAELLRSTNASFKLGFDYTNWLRSGRNFIHPFGSHGTVLRLVPFHHYYLKYRQLGETTAYGAYSLAESAAREGRFSLPQSDPRSILSTFANGIHVDTAQYAEWMRSLATKLGVSFVRGEVAGARQSAESGCLEALLLDDGSIVEGDLFIDCTGDQGRLIEGVLNRRRVDWSEYLPCDSVTAFSAGSLPDMPPLTFVVGKNQGWLRRIPMRDRNDYEFFYCSAFHGDKQVHDSFASDLGRNLLGEPRSRRFASGCREDFWFRNCVAIGRSAGIMEPLEVSALSLAQSAVLRLLRLFPSRDCDAVIAEEYNRQTRQEYSNLLDFVCLAYHSAGRGDSDFWRHVKTLAMPDTLRERLELFTSHGRLVWKDHELLPKEYWVSAFLGFGHLPESYDPLADVPSEGHVVEWLARIRGAVAEAMRQMPAHGDFLETMLSDRS